jgi:hypothetical protein
MNGAMLDLSDKGTVRAEGEGDGRSLVIFL